VALLNRDREVLVELAESRRTSLLQSFLIALTRGGPDGMPRPIEFHAHDPVRYVGDMLAWVHQAIAWENEYFESLFSVNNKTRMMGSIRVFDPNAGDQRNEDRWIRQLMDSDVEGLCKPLKVWVSFQR
jgi:conserved oligomeric Golgi complex subunit 6